MIIRFKIFEKILKKSLLFLVLNQEFKYLDKPMKINEIPVGILNIGFNKNFW